ncbi:hypothetical protein [Phocaeicola sp.]
MKIISKILLAVGIIGLMAAVSLADTICPTTKETVSSIVILSMSLTDLLLVAYIEELSSNKKQKYGNTQK